MRLKKLTILVLVLSMVLSTLIVAPMVQAQTTETYGTGSITIFSATDNAGDGYGPGTASATFSYVYADQGYVDEADITNFEVSYEKDDSGNWWYVFHVRTATILKSYPGYAMSIGTTLWDFYLYNPSQGTPTTVLPNWGNDSFTATPGWTRLVRLYGNGLVVNDASLNVLYSKFTSANDGNNFKFVKDSDGKGFKLYVSPSYLGVPIKNIKVAVLAGEVGAVDEDNNIIKPAIVDSSYGNENGSPYVYDILGNNATYLDAGSSSLGMPMMSTNVYELSDVQGVKTLSIVGSPKDQDLSATTTPYNVKYTVSFTPSVPKSSGLLIVKEQPFVNIDGTEYDSEAVNMYHNASLSSLTTSGEVVTSTNPTNYLIVGYKIYEGTDSSTVVKTATDIVWQKLTTDATFTYSTLYVTDVFDATLTVSAPKDVAGLPWKLVDSHDNVYASGTFDIVDGNATITVKNIHIPENEYGVWRFVLPYGQEYTFTVKNYATASLDATNSKIVSLNYASEKPTATYTINGQFKFVVSPTDAMTSTSATIAIYVDDNLTATKVITATFARNATVRVVPFTVSVNATTSTYVLVKVLDAASNVIDQQYYWDKAKLYLSLTNVYAGNTSATYSITATASYHDGTSTQNLISNLVEPLTFKVYDPQNDLVGSYTTTTGTVSFVFNPTKIGTYVVEVEPFGSTLTITATYQTPEVVNFEVIPNVINEKPSGTTTYTGTVDVTITATKYYTRITGIEYGLYIDGNKITSTTTDLVFEPSTTLGSIPVSLPANATVNSVAVISATVNGSAKSAKVWANYSVTASPTEVYAGISSVSVYTITATIRDENNSVATDSDLYIKVIGPDNSVVKTATDNSSYDSNADTGVITATVAFKKPGKYIVVTKFGATDAITATYKVIQVTGTVTGKENWAGYSSGTNAITGTVSVKATYDPRYYTKIEVPVDLYIDDATASVARVYAEKIVAAVNTASTSTTKNYDVAFTITRNFASAPTKFVKVTSNTSFYYWVKWNVAVTPSVLAVGNTSNITGTVTDYADNLVTSMPNSSDAVTVVLKDRDGDVIKTATTNTGTFTFTDVYVPADKIGLWKVEVVDGESVITSTTINAGYQEGNASKIEIVPERFDAPKSTLTIKYTVKLATTTKVDTGVPVTERVYIDGVEHTYTRTVYVLAGNDSAYYAEIFDLGTSDYSKLWVKVESGSVSDYWYYYGEETINSVNAVDVISNPSYTSMPKAVKTGTNTWKISGIPFKVKVTLPATAAVYSATVVPAEAYVGLVGTSTVYTGTTSVKVIVSADHKSGYAEGTIDVAGIESTATPDIAYIKVTATTADNKVDTAFIWNKCSIDFNSDVYAKVVAQTLTGTLNCAGTGALVNIYLKDSSGAELASQTLNVSAAETPFSLTATLNKLATYTIVTEFGQEKAVKTVRKDITDNISTVTVTVESAENRPSVGSSVTATVNLSVDTATDTYRSFEVKYTLSIDGNQYPGRRLIAIAPGVTATTVVLEVSVTATPSESVRFQLTSPVSKVPQVVWANWNISLATTTIMAKNEAYTITGTVSDENGSVAYTPNSIVKLYDPKGQEIASTTVQPGGVFSITATFDKVGVYKFVGKYGSTATLQTTAAEVEPSSVAIVNVTPDHFYKAEKVVNATITVNVKATATEETYAQYVEIPVVLISGTQTVASATLKLDFAPGATIATGSAQLKTASAPVNELKVKAGSVERILWKKYNLSISASSDRNPIGKGDNVTITGTLSDYEGNVVSGVSIEIISPSNSVVKKDVVTNASGTFTATIVASEPGTWKVQTATSSYYAESTFKVLPVIEKTGTVEVEAYTHSADMPSVVSATIKVTIEATEAYVNVPVEVKLNVDGTNILQPITLNFAPGDVEKVTNVTFTDVNATNYIVLVVNGEEYNVWAKGEIEVVGHAYVGDTVSGVVKIGGNGAQVDVKVTEPDGATKTITTATDGTFSMQVNKTGTYTLKVEGSYYRAEAQIVVEYGEITGEAKSIEVETATIDDLPQAISDILGIGLPGVSFPIYATVTVSINATDAVVNVPVVVKLISDGNVVTSTTINVKFNVGETEKTFNVQLDFTDESQIPTEYAKVVAYDQNNNTVKGEGYIWKKPSVVTVTISLNKGINLVTIPVNTASTIGEIFAGMYVFRYEKGRFGRVTNSYLPSVGETFLVYTLAAKDITIIGAPVNTVVMTTINKGINLTGNPFSYEYNLANVTVVVNGEEKTLSDVSSQVLVFVYRKGRFSRVTNIGNTTLNVGESVLVYNFTGYEITMKWNPVTH